MAGTDRRSTPPDEAADDPPLSVEALTGPGRDAALSRLHAMLLRATRAELARRAPRVGITGPELTDLAHQAADDAVVSILRRLSEFRGESRFTTWAYKFAILEVSSKLGRHFWNRPALALEPEQWEQLPARFGVAPELAAEARDMITVVRAAVDNVLTERQRLVFVALVVHGIPLDALAAKLTTDRNTLYKVMFDARRKIRAELVTKGYLIDPARMVT
ncbi:MAG TPA: sigma-70 family RNA polymerase sigma factor [Jatrophihabitans sp.]|nr:sigma-70 family RNA polymerase sigma factor [Jatrophihabitans sp.]